jgi:hypothetical protein
MVNYKRKMNRLKEKMHHTKLSKKASKSKQEKNRKNRVSNHPITPFPDQIKQKRKLEFPEVA